MQFLETIKVFRNSKMVLVAELIRHRLWSRSVLVCAVILVLTTIPDFIMGQYNVAVFGFVAAIPFLVMHFLGKKRVQWRPMLRDVFMAYIFFIVFLFDSCYSRTGPISQFYVPLIISIFLFISFDRWTFVPHLIYPFALFFLARFGNISILPESFKLPEEGMEIVAIFNTFLCLVLSIYFLQLIIRIYTRIAFRLRVENQHRQKTMKELDRFVYTVSHDLKGGVNNIHSLAELIPDASDANREKISKKLLESTEALNEFISDLLDSVNSKSKVKLVTVDIQNLVEEQVDAVSDNDKALVDIKLDIDVKTFLSDERLVELILRNLLSNAVRYTKGVEYPQITISAKLVDDALSITMADNGLGIRDTSQIFAKFYREHASIKGSGLGLFLVKDAIEKLNGRIGVQSKEGVGSTFHVHLPMLKA